MYDMIGKFIESLALSWQRNVGWSRLLIAVGTIAAAVGIGVSSYADSQHLASEVRYLGIAIAVAGGLVLAVLAALEQVRDHQKKEEEIQQVEAKARENPEKPEYAWDLARSKLERYLDRNLSEVRAIFFLTSLVMVAGFALVLYGLLKAFSDPASLPVSIVSAASGVLLSFIGGSFLLIYRSVLAQSASYVAILERINAVGMAVQIASTVPDTDAKLKSETTASLAKALLTMYGQKATSRARSAG